MAAPIFPDSFFEIIRESVDRHKDNLPKATASAIRKIRDLDEFEAWRDKLADSHIATLVTQRRKHANEIALRVGRESLDDIETPKPTIHRGREIDLPDVVSDLIEGITLDYFIGSKTLGGLTGLELRECASTLSAKGSKLIFLSRLCGRLCNVVEPDQKVRDVITNAQLSEIVAEVQRGSSGEAA